MKTDSNLNFFLFIVDKLVESFVDSKSQDLKFVIVIVKWQYPQVFLVAEKKNV